MTVPQFLEVFVEVMRHVSQEWQRTVEQSVGLLVPQVGEELVKVVEKSHQEAYRSVSSATAAVIGR